MSGYSLQGPFNNDAAPPLNATRCTAMDQGIKDAHDQLDSHVAAAAPHSGHETPSGAQAKVDAHAGLTSPHSATSQPTASRLVLRDASGRAQVAAPSAASDIARKDTVDAHTSRTDNPHVVTLAQLGAAAENHTHKTKKAVVLAVQGALTVGDDAIDFDPVAFEQMELVEVVLSVVTAPAGGDLTINVAIADGNGTGVQDLFSAANRPKITDGSFVGTGFSTFAVGTVAKGKKFRLDVDAANGAADLMVYLVYKAASDTEA